MYLKMSHRSIFLICTSNEMTPVITKSKILPVVFFNTITCETFITRNEINHVHVENNSSSNSMNSTSIQNGKTQLAHLRKEKGVFNSGKRIMTLDKRVAISTCGLMGY